MGWSKNWGGYGRTWGAWERHATRWRPSGAFSLGRRVAREGLKDLCLGQTEAEFSSPTFLSPQTTHLKTQVTSPDAAAPSTWGAFLQRHQPVRESGPFLD